MVLESNSMKGEIVMKLRNVILILSVILLMAASHVPAKSGNAGAADRITGGLEVVTQAPPITAKVEFTAHADTGNRPAKGMFRWYRADQPRLIVCSVTYVTVDGNTGAFVAKKTEDTDPGPSAKDWIVVKANDGGSPGAENDWIGFIWFDTETAAIDYANNTAQWPSERPIVAGNLVVHSK